MQFSCISYWVCSASYWHAADVRRRAFSPNPMASTASPKDAGSGVATALPTHTPLFVGLLISVVLIVGALTFIPALALGPIVEHLHMGGLR